MDSNVKQTTPQPQINQTPTAPVAPPVTSTPPAPKPPENKNKIKSLLFLEIGLLEIGFVILMLLIFFGVLNFFNILSLSSIYPDQLGFLPHIKKDLKFKTLPTINTTTAIPRIKDTSDPTNLNFEAQIFRIDKDVIQVNYAGDLYGLILTDKTKCSANSTNENTQASTSSDLTTLPIFCTNLLQNSNVNKQVLINFQVIKGNNTINSITVE